MALALALALALPSVARADINALATSSGNQDPVIADGRVIWSTRSGKSSIRVFSRSVGGGPVQVVARATLTAADGRVAGWDLVAAPGWIGVRAKGVKGRGMRLFGGPPGSQLSLLRSGVPFGSVLITDRDTWAWPAGGFVTLERRAGARDTEPPRKVVVTDASGATRAIALPPGADLTKLAVAGTKAAVPIRDQKGLLEVDVLDLISGAVERRVEGGPVRPLGTVISLSLSPEGELAITGEDGVGSDGLGWAPAGATQLQLVRMGDQFGPVQVSHGRIAMVGPKARQFAHGERVFVYEPRGPDQEPNVVFRSPAAAHVEALDFDGNHVAWGTQSCQLVADATPADSNLVVPPGPCLRTQVTTTAFTPPKVRGAAVGIEFTCITSPDDRCRLRVTALEFPAAGGRGRRIGARRASVPHGTTRLVYIPVSPAVADRLRREKSTPGFSYTVVDPDGRRGSDFAI